MLLFSKPQPKQLTTPKDSHGDEKKYSQSFFEGQDVGHRHRRRWHLICELAGILPVILDPILLFNQVDVSKFQCGRGMSDVAFLWCSCCLLFIQERRGFGCELFYVVDTQQWQPWQISLAVAPLLLLPFSQNVDEPRFTSKEHESPLYAPVEEMHFHDEHFSVLFWITTSRVCPRRNRHGIPSRHN